MRTSAVPLVSGLKVSKRKGGEEGEVFSTEIKKTEVLMENFHRAIGLRIKGKKTEVLMENFRRAIGLRIKGK